MNPADHQLQTAAGWIREASRIVILTGAGLSAESGIATFRDAGGFWQRFPPEQFATWDGLLNKAARRPDEMADFLLELLIPIAQARPNPGHFALARLEGQSEVTLVTQNVDGLHQLADSRAVKEIHGTFFELVNETGERVGTLSRADLSEVVEAVQEARADGFERTKLAVAIRPLLGLGPRGFYRPKLVLFGEAMCEPDWTDALTAARSCDVLLSVGTSGLVQPAASLPDEAAANGAKCVCLNPEEEAGDLWLKGTAVAVLPALVQAAFSV